MIITQSERPADLIGDNAMEKRGPFCHIIDGVPYHLYIDPINLRKTFEFQPQEGDIIVLTYPKSGTHWIQQIVQLILYRGESAANYMEFALRAPFLEYEGEEALDRVTSPRIIRTHLTIGRFPYSEKAKYVYVARNPWDCCVSAYHFIKQLPKLEDYGTFDQFFEIFLKGETGAGEYFNHVVLGYSRRAEPNVFFVTYEDLRSNTSEIVVKLAHFLGPEHGKSVEETPGLLQAILEKSSLEYMKPLVKLDHKLLGDMFVKNQDMKTVTTNDTSDGEISLVREGKIGGWKELFKPEHLRKIEARILEVPGATEVMESLWKEQWRCARQAMEE